MEIQKFIRLMFSLAGDQSGCYGEMDFFVREPGSRVHREQVVELLSCAPGLLFQLPRGTITRTFSLIESSCRNLEEVALGRIPVLTDHQHLRIFPSWVAQEGHDCARAWMPDHLQFADRSVGKSDGVGIERDDLPRIDPPGFYPSCVLF